MPDRPSRAGASRRLVLCATYLGFEPRLFHQYARDERCVPAVSRLCGRKFCPPPAPGAPPVNVIKVASPALPEVPPGDTIPVIWPFGDEGLPVIIEERLA